MSNNKQQTSVEWLWEIAYNRELTVEDWKQAKEMEVAGKEISYADGYKEGYKRAYELMEWCMKNYIKGRVQDHIGDTNKKVDE
jgi:flagellar biosynthesis/type III secretory pathway protein FliH